MDTFTHSYEDGGVLFEMAKAGKGNKRHSRSGIALFHSLHSRPRPAGEDGRIYIRGAVGGQQRSSGVDMSCEETSSGKDTPRFREEGQRRREGG